jgi:hypothetical protein
MGYLLGEDCAEIDKEQSDICVVDRLVLPLVSILFPNNAISLEAKLVALRRHCTEAFSKAFRGVYYCSFSSSTLLVVCLLPKL